MASFSTICPTVPEKYDSKPTAQRENQRCMHWFLSGFGLAGNKKPAIAGFIIYSSQA
jgi:hypothetical protein